ncbi:MAG: shikimate kinase [Solirubrobacterales bacterium]
MKKNIVLIGMPGAGKTTIGKILSERLQLEFIDVDDFIEKESGKTISELFNINEEHFRSVESKACRTLSNNYPIVIATGGGVVKNPTNMEALKSTGFVIFIDRPIEDIAGDVEISKRPLLKDGLQKLYPLYNERYDLYIKYSDLHVFNDKKIEDVVDKIIEKYTLA